MKRLGHLLRCLRSQRGSIPLCAATYRPLRVDSRLKSSKPKMNITLLQCSVCKKSKPREEFAIKPKAKRGRAYKCKECKRKYNKVWYEENKDKHIQAAAVHSKKRKDRILALVWKLKSGPCMDCHKKYHPICMDFDHPDPSNKTMAVSQMIMWGKSEESIFEEIDKCELVCSNCHRLRTHLRLCSLKEKAGGFYPQD